MADMEKSIAECCKQLKLSANLAGQTFKQKGDTPQEYLLNLDYFPLATNHKNFAGA